MSYAENILITSSIDKSMLVVWDVDALFNTSVVDSESRLYYVQFFNFKSDSSHLIALEHLKFNKNPESFLGFGQYGKVYRGLYRDIPVAVKLFYENIESNHKEAQFVM